MTLSSVLAFERSQRLLFNHSVRFAECVLGKQRATLAKHTSRMEAHAWLPPQTYET